MNRTIPEWRLHSVVMPAKAGIQCLPFRCRNIRRMFLVLSILLMAPVAGGVDFSIPWYTIDAGGEMFSSGGDFELSGTIGQPDATGARALSGGQWKLTGGFWGASLGEVADHVFSDGFEQEE
jgi:hypothetical protein